MDRKKTQKDKKRIFSFLIRYITISMICIILVISLIFFFVYRNFEIYRITDTSIKSLFQLSLGCSSLFDSLRKLTLQIYEDKDISMLINDPNLAPEDTYRANNRLSYYTLGVTSITSIYVYYRSTDCIFTSVGGYSKSSRFDFFDSSAVSIVEYSGDIVSLSPVPRKVVLPYMPDVPNNETNIYSLVYFGSPAAVTERSYDKAVFLNVSEEWMKESLELWNKDMEGDICVINNEGLVVSSLYNGVFLQDLSGNAFVSKILGSKQESGYFVDNVSGIKSFVTYVFSYNPEWYFVRIIPYNIIYSDVRKVGLLTAGIFLFNILIGYMLSYLLTRNAEKSINDIIDGLKKEIDENKTELSKLKDEYLCRCLNGNESISRENIEKTFRKYAVKLSCLRNIYIVMFSIDHYNKLCGNCNPYDRSILKQAVISIVSREFSKMFTTEAVDMGDDHIILILNYSESLKNYMYEIDNMVINVQRLALKNLKMSLSAALSSTGYTFCDANLLYTEVKQASNYRLFYGHGCIIHTWDIKKQDSKEYIYPVKKEKMLFDALMLNKVEKAKSILNEILSSTRDYHYTVLNSLLLRLTSSVSEAFTNIGNTSTVSIDYSFNSFMSSLNYCETIEEIRNKYYEMFDHVSSIIEEKKTSKYELVVSKVYDIINNHYFDDNLCLNNIAAEIELSPDYLGKLFKTYTSKSVADHINEIRMKNASALLEKSDLTICGVSEKVGFVSSNYFYTVFKKTFGVTPAEYRQKVKNNAV